MRALFVHGLNSDKNSSTGKIVKEVLADLGIEVIVDTFDLLDPSATREKIKTFVPKINFLIGHSLGGFYVLAETSSVAKIVINPCMFPSAEIPNLARVPDELKKRWERMEDVTYTDYVDAEMRSCAFGIFAKSDELFSYLDTFKDFYGRPSAGKINYVSVEGGHRLGRDGLELPLTEAVSYFENLRQSLQAEKDFMPYYEAHGQEKRLQDKLIAATREKLDAAMEEDEYLNRLLSTPGRNLDGRYKNLLETGGLPEYENSTLKDLIVGSLNTIKKGEALFSVAGDDERLRGFVAYAVNDKNEVTRIKMCSFYLDQNNHGFVKDLDGLVGKLLEEHPKVSWASLAKNKEGLRLSDYIICKRNGTKTPFKNMSGDDCFLYSIERK